MTKALTIAQCDQHRDARQDIRVEYLLSEVLMDLEFDFDNENPGEPMTITAFEDDDDDA